MRPLAVTWLVEHFPSIYGKLRVQNLLRFQEAVSRVNSGTEPGKRGPRPKLDELDSETVFDLSVLYNTIARSGICLGLAFYRKVTTDYLRHRDIKVEVTNSLTKGIMRSACLRSVKNTGAGGREGMRTPTEIRDIRDRATMRLAFIVARHQVPPALVCAADEAPFYCYPRNRSVWVAREVPSWGMPPAAPMP